MEPVDLNIIIHFLHTVSRKEITEDTPAMLMICLDEKTHNLEETIHHKYLHRNGLTVIFLVQGRSLTMEKNLVILKKAYNKFLIRQRK